MTSVLRFIMALAATVAVMTPWQSAHAQSGSDAEITVIQPKPLLRRQRIELVPRASWTLNDPYVDQLSVGGSLFYSATERFFFGPTFEWFDFGPNVGGTTGRFDDVVDATNTVPEVAVLDWYAGIDFSWIPAYGKFVLFNRSVVYFDLFVTIGAGVAYNGRDYVPGGVLAIGAHTYFNRWFGMTFEYRDRLTYQELPSGNNRLWQTASVSVGLNFFIPPNFRYTYDEEEER